MATAQRMQQVAQYQDLIGKSQAVFICEYRGLTVEKITAIRAKVREAGGQMKVGKNTLMRIALTEQGLPVPEGMTTGPNVYTMAYGDAAAVAKALRDFAKEKGNEKLVIKGGILGTQVLDAAGVSALADLPPKEVMLGQVVGTIAAPLRGLVTVLSGTTRGLVTCLSQIKDKKEEAA